VRSRVSLILVAFLAVLVSVAAAGAATITVTTTADDVATNGNCTLREAVLAANNDIPLDKCAKGAGADTINLPSGTFRLAIAGTGEDQGVTGDLDVTGVLIIQGASAASTIVDANHLDRVIDVRPGASLTLRKITVRGGRLAGYDAIGAGIYAGLGSLIVEDSDVRDNQTITDYCSCDPYTGGCGCDRQGVGGGIAASGVVTIRRSRILDNHAGRGGGMDVGGAVNVEDSEIASNHGDYGAGVQVESDTTASFVGVDVHHNVADLSTGTYGSQIGGVSISESSGTTKVTFSECSIRSNRATSDGGGLYIFEGGSSNVTVEIRKSTIADNVTPWDGGGIRIVAGGKVLLEDSTVTRNEARSGAGMTSSEGKLTIRRSLISDNRGQYVPGLIATASSYSGSIDMTSSTLSNNVATVQGGNLRLIGIAGSLRNVTVIGPSLAEDPTSLPNPEVVSIRNSIFAGGSCWGVAPDLVMQSGGGNLESPGNRCGFDNVTDLVGVADPRLAPLAESGGYAATHALLPGSPAIDSGVADKCDTKDQRGFARPVDGNHDGISACDRGAYELTCTGSDGDGDGIADGCDNCADVANPDQSDWNGNGTGDACDTLACGAVPGVDRGRAAAIGTLAWLSPVLGIAALLGLRKRRSLGLIPAPARGPWPRGAGYAEATPRPRAS